MIRHGELLGYSQAEHLMVAAIARYHRRSLPKKRHEAWQTLIKKDNRRVVSEMALLLRLAAALDCRPEPAVEAIKIRSNGSQVTFELIPYKTEQNLELERWSLMNCSFALKNLYDIELKVI